MDRRPILSALLALALSTISFGQGASPPSHSSSKSELRPEGTSQLSPARERWIDLWNRPSPGRTTESARVAPYGAWSPSTSTQDFRPGLILVAPPELEIGSDTPPTLTNDQIRTLIRQAAEKDLQNNKKQRDYTYVRREEEHKLNGKGEQKSTEVRTYDVMMLYGEQVRRLTSKDDKPLSEKDAAKEEEKIQKIIDKGRNESDSNRNKRLEKEEKERDDDRKFVSEVADAYNFRLVAVEPVNGRDAYVIDADPRPGFQPKLRDAKMLPNFRFRVWIDIAESQWVKIDLQCIETASFGWILARIHKGSNIVIELARINEDVWLPKHVARKLDARIALFKGLNIDEDVTYRDYKKFHTEIRIIPLGEEQGPH